jgi:hypothetical protein
MHHQYGSDIDIFPFDQTAPVKKKKKKKGNEIREWISVAIAFGSLVVAIIELLK